MDISTITNHLTLYCIRNRLNFDQRKRGKINVN